ncbi:MAG: BsuBI/PstI family type II restriction endonuclease [Desulfovermiculus sp.]
MITTGAVIERSGLPTTSAKPRYALRKDFAKLFDPALKGNALQKVIKAWQEKHLSSGALARVHLLRKGLAASKTKDRLLVQFPNGETRSMAPGPSSVITKAVIEEFAPRFLRSPKVLWISESGELVVTRDDELARSIGLEIQSDRHLPDIILVDLEPEDPLIVFCEVVATDGPVNELRQEALLEYIRHAGFKDTDVAFVTAYLDRGNQAFKKTFPLWPGGLLPGVPQSLNISLPCIKDMNRLS